MLTFALDTATASPSLALVRDEDPIAELWLAPEPGSGRRVLEAGHGLLVSAGLAVTDLDAIVVGVGPGGFTGLRIGLATALGLGQALAVPVTGASSLEALALGIAAELPDGSLVAPMLDARRRELFTAVYRSRGGDLEELVVPLAVAPQEFIARLRDFGEPVGIGGEGVEAAGDGIREFTVLPAGAPAHRLSAAALVRRVRSGAGRPARPVYARLPGRGGGPDARGDRGGVVGVPRGKRTPPVPTTRIRQMRNGDVPQVVVIEAASSNTPWTRAMFQSEIGRPGTIDLVADRGGDILGYIMVSRYADVWHILNVCVREAQRGQGIGAQLLEELFERAAGTTNLGFTLEVRVSNATAIRLYRRKGFVEHGIRPGYYSDNGEDAIIMWRGGGPEDGENGAG